MFTKIFIVCQWRAADTVQNNNIGRLKMGTKSVNYKRKDTKFTLSMHDDLTCDRNSRVSSFNSFHLMFYATHIAYCWSQKQIKCLSWTLCHRKVLSLNISTNYNTPSPSHLVSLHQRHFSIHRSTLLSRMSHSMRPWAATLFNKFLNCLFFFIKFIIFFLFPSFCVPSSRRRLFPAYSLKYAIHFHFLIPFLVPFSSPFA